MVDGTVDPETVKVKGIMMPEEIAAKEAERKEQELLQAEKKEVLRLKRKVEEKERWWGGADLFREEEDEKKVSEAQGVYVEDGSADSKLKSKVKSRYDFDYSRWDTWTPDDEATKEEMAAKDAADEAAKNAAFEKDNAEFCENFTTDMKERQKKVDKKLESANVMRLKGNNEFKKKDYSTALVHYMDALKVLPYESKTLLNIAQVSIKQKNWEDALEFIDRVLYLNANHVKAMSRKAFVLTEMDNTADAFAVCSKALDLDPTNADIAKQHKELAAIHRDAVQEKEVVALADKAEANMKERMTNPPGSSEASPDGTCTTGNIPALGNLLYGQDGGKTEAEQLEALRGMSLDDLTKAFETSMGGMSTGEGAFQTFNSVLKALQEGRVSGDVPDAPTGMPVLPGAPKKFNVFDALSEIMEDDANMRVYFRTSGALALCSVCLRNMLVKVAPEVGLGQIKPAEWTGTGADPAVEHASIHHVNAIFAMLAVACKGERTIKVILSEDTAILAAQQVVVAVGGADHMDGLRFKTLIDMDTTLLAGALPGALRLLEQCVQGDEAPKVVHTICADKDLPIALGKLLGELSTQMESAPKKTDGYKMLQNVGDALSEVAGWIVTSAAGQKHVVETCSGGLIVCGLGALLSSLDVDTEEGLISVILQTLSMCSRLSGLQPFFAVPLPGKDSVVQCCTATSILGIANGLCKAGGIIGPIRSTKVSNLQRILLDCALGLLSNACMDKETGPDSVRGTLAAAGAVELSLQAASTCITRHIQKCKDATARADDSSPDGRLFAGLLSRLTGVESVQKALALPGPFRLLCKMVSNIETAIRELPVDASESLQTTFGHFVTIVAHLTKYPDIRPIAAEEGLLVTILGAFPEPRTSLGSITPDSVTKAPERPVNALLVGNAAMVLRAFADDDVVGKPVFTYAKYIAVEKLICALATCTNVAVRKNIATVLAKACRHPGVKEKMTKFRGMQIIRELNNQGTI